MPAVQRLLLLMAVVRTTGHHLIADIQSTETVASPMAAFWSAAVPRHQAVLEMLEFSYLGQRKTFVALKADGLQSCCSATDTFIILNLAKR